MQTYSTVRSIDSRSYVQPKIVSTKLFSTKCCVSYMLSLLGRSALERHFLGVPTAWIFTETPLIKFDMIFDVWGWNILCRLQTSKPKSPLYINERPWNWITYMYISDRVFIAHKWQIMHAFLSSIFFFKTTLNFSGILSKCQTVWIQIKPDILSCLIWVQLICKGYQRPTLVSRQIYAITAKISWAGPNMRMVFKRLIIFASQGY